MSVSDREYDSRLSLGTQMNPLVILIAISIIIFVVLALFKAVILVMYAEGTNIQPLFEKNILRWFALSPVPNMAVGKAWTFITHSFVHVSFWPLLADMLWLWCFGYIFIDLTGNRKLIPVFLYGTLAGAAGYLGTAIFLPAVANGTTGHYFFGSGAGILAVCTAAIAISPHYKLFPMLGGGIPLWILGIVYLAIDMATLPPANPAQHIAHLSGGLAGFMFIYILRRGYDGSDWMNYCYDWFINLFNPEVKTSSRKGIKNTTFYSTTTKPITRVTTVTQTRLDEILDKINMEGGYDKLTEEEKEYLSKASEEDFQR